MINVSFSEFHHVMMLNPSCSRNKRNLMPEYAKCAHQRRKGCINVKLQNAATHKRYKEQIEGETQSRKHCNCHCLHNRQKKHMQVWGVSNWSKCYWQTEHMDSHHQKIDLTIKMCFLPAETKIHIPEWSLFSPCSQLQSSEQEAVEQMAMARFRVF